ncbi:Mov34/MPN/PAD-1 family protein [Anabaena subtropica]|uniref:M67 family metallopeptidase n=1 Tax=Anabaena subtropica FACHB-260 TaxID=2692884 RepID=A0ABR8CPJ4_9NOST|nr:M67 family metallopeptidase [Anabaena subtropica]MBD2344488.1 M67 family metallopeptidase [Anabaena subtropica FACHB-260]
MNQPTIKLLPKHQQTIFTHAERVYPEECCGLMMGYIADDVKTVVEVIPTANAWETEADNFSQEITKANISSQVPSLKRRYAIAPQIMLQVQREARDKALNIIGIYHSHPDHPAIPSECDRLYAWAGYSYIIVSVQNGVASDILSWSLDDNHQFQSEIIDNII